MHSQLRLPNWTVCKFDYFTSLMKYLSKNISSVLSQNKFNFVHVMINYSCAKAAIKCAAYKDETH